MKCFTLSGITVSGKCLAQAFIEGLDESEKKKIVALLQRSADHGPLRNNEKFRHLEDKIYEFKSYQVRVLCFFEKEKLILLTHGFTKKRDKTPKEEIERARRLIKEYQNERKEE